MRVAKQRKTAAPRQIGMAEHEERCRIVTERIERTRAHAALTRMDLTAVERTFATEWLMHRVYTEALIDFGAGRVERPLLPAHVALHRIRDIEAVYEADRDARQGGRFSKALCNDYTFLIALHVAELDPEDPFETVMGWVRRCLPEYVESEATVRDTVLHCVTKRYDWDVNRIRERLGITAEQAGQAGLRSLLKPIGADPVSDDIAPFEVDRFASDGGTDAAKPPTVH